jgi:type I restriction enzyme S subunit
MTTFKSLRELVSFRGGGTPSKQVPEYWNGDIPWASVKDFTSTSLSETQDFISQEGLMNSSANLIPKGHVIIPTRMSLGKAAINTIDLAINQDLRALVPIVPLDTQFLLHAVLSLKDEIVKKGSGATVKGITQEELYKLEIAFPPLDDQIRVAHLLGKVEGLIAQRKQQLKQLDGLLKSVFLKMFGHPVRNERGWIRRPLEELGSLSRGVSKHRPRNAPELLGGKYPLIQTGEVSNAGTYITNFSHTYSDIGFTQSKLWPSGTLCITIAANIAQTAVLTFDACFPDSVVGFSAFEDDAHALYVHGLFWFFQKILEKNAPAAAQKNINLEILRGMEVPKPPVELQARFASVVERIEGIKSRYQQSLTELEALYGALSQQAFRGELDLSRVPLPDSSIAGENSVASTPLPAQVASPTIDLPETELLLPALIDREQLKRLLNHWLEAYLGQLGDGAFSVKDFMQASEARVAELHPNNDFELGADAYDHIKVWAFKALGSGALEQAYPDENIRLALRRPRSPVEG